MAQTKIKAGLFEGIIGNGTDGYFLMSNGDGTMTWSSIIINPTISSIAYPGSATAADPAGDETITVTGTGFKTGATVTVGGTTATVVSYVSETQITFTTPAKAAGDYDIVVTNTDTGSATFINGISYNGTPTWTTATGSLGTFASDTTISTITLQATEPDAGTITFNITNGALPTGLSLTGADIDGTTSLETADTLYTFTVTATDDESQATPRTFTITVKKQFINTENFTINTYTGNGSTQSIEGKIGTAASFNGSSSYISGFPTLTNPTGNSFSVSLWVNTSSTDKTIFGGVVDEPVDFDSIFRIRVNSSGQAFTDYRPSQQSPISTVEINSSTSISDGNWHHIVSIVTDSQIKLYVDGSEESNSPQSITGTANVTNAVIGALNNRGTIQEYLNGKLDQVRIFNKALSPSEVTTLYSESNTSTTKSTTDIFGDGSGVALYEFEEGAKDTGGVNGYIGAGGVFNGSSSYINLGSASSLVSTNFTFSAWIKTTATSTDWIIGTDINPYYSKVAVRSEGDGTLTCRYGNYTSSENAFTSSYNTINNGEWHHIVYFINQTTAKLYIDGSLDTTHTLTVTPTTNGNLTLGGIYIANSSSYSSSTWADTIDQVRIFNKELSSSEVTTLYNETSASATKSTTDIFDDGSGIALYELEGNANDSGRFGSGAIDSGQSAVFNGTTSIFNFPNTAYGASTTVFTVSGWFKHTSTANNREDIYFGNGATVSGNTGYALFTDYSSGNIALSFRDTDQSQVFYTSSSNIKDGSWYHLCLTYNNGPYVVYLNGASILNGTSPDFTSNQTPSYNTYIGNRYGDTGSNRSIIGAVDQVRIYSSALSASDVKALVSETNVPTTNLTAHYKLDGNANDETGSYNGTASNITYSDPAEFPTYDGTATNVSYAYDGTPTNVSFVGTSFEPDLVWIKDRGGAESHQLFDSIRGVGKVVESDDTSGEVTRSNSLTSFDSNGFTLGADSGGFVNYVGRGPYVAWCWKAGGSAVSNTNGTITSTVSANPDAGFSIVTYTTDYNGSNNVRVGHGLGTTPRIILTKARNNADNWFFANNILSGTTDWEYMFLNTTNTQTTSFTFWDGANAPNDQTFRDGNPNGNQMVAYCFADVDGYQKVGSYSGTGTAGNAQNIGFKPRFLLARAYNVVSDWFILDSVRQGSDSVDLYLFPNSATAEGGGGNSNVNFTDTGFSFDGASYNDSGRQFIYLAIA